MPTFGRSTPEGMSRSTVFRPPITSDRANSPANASHQGDSASRACRGLSRLLVIRSANQPATPSSAEVIEAIHSLALSATRRVRSFSGNTAASMA